MSKPLGIQGTIHSLRSANGTAQYLMFAVWGVIMAGMFINMHLQLPLVMAWMLCSFAVAYSTVFATRKTIQRALLVDTFLTIAIAARFLHNSFEDHQTLAVDIRHFAHAMSLLIMASHGFYLSNLVHRQRLELNRVLGTNE